jgi:hypothetical protein
MCWGAGRLANCPIQTAGLCTYSTVYKFLGFPLSDTDISYVNRLYTSEEIKLSYIVVKFELLYLFISRYSVKILIHLHDLIKGTLTQDTLAFFIIFNIKSVFSTCTLMIFKFFLCLLILIFNF